MLNIQANPAQKNTAQKGVHYPLFLKLSDNRRIGFSKAQDGTTDAKGTLFPNNFNDSTNFGNLQNAINNQHNNAGGYILDSGLFTNNEVKHKTGERWIQKYKTIKSMQMVAPQTTFNTSGMPLTSSGGLRCNKALPMSTDKYVVIYQKSSSSGLYARVNTVASDGTITYGTEQILSTNTTSWGYVDFCEINTGKYAVIYRDPSNNLATVVFTVSGSTITLGTPVVTAITGSSVHRIVKVDVDKYLYMYVFSSTETRMRICTVSGTTITGGTDTSCTTSRYGYDVQMQSTTLGLVLQNDASGNLYGRTFSISGTTPTFNTDTLLISGNYSVNAVYDDVMKWISGGLYYYHNYNVGKALLIEVVSTVPSIVHNLDINTTSQGDVNCYYMSAPVDTGTNEFAYQYINGSNNQIWLADVIIDTTNKLISYTYAKAYYSDNYTYMIYSAIAKIGSSQFIATGSNVSDNSGNLSQIVMQSASVEVRYNAESSPFVTISNATMPWAYKTANMIKAVNAGLLYLNFKNVSGASRNIFFADLTVEVD